MKKYFMQMQNLVALLAILLFITSCNGQVKDQPQKDVTESKTRTDDQPKMIKTQGKFAYHLATGPYADTNVCIRAILEDKNGNIWVATMGEGVYRYDGKTFTNFTVKDGLTTNVVYCMIEDKDGNLWFGTTDGVSRYNGTSFKNFPFSVIRGNLVNQFSININNPLKEPFNQYKEVWCMRQDKTGKIWFGTTDGVYCYDGVKFTNIADLDISRNSSLKHTTVSSIVEDKAGNIWFTSWADGLCRFDGKSITKLTDEGFNTMLLDRNGNLWLGRRGESRDAGVYRYDGKTFTKLLSDTGYIPDMAEDKTGNLWFSNGSNRGIIYFNPSTSETISRFTTKNGLSGDNVTAITIDKSGNVWFGMCGMTLSRYDGKTFTNFHSE